MKAWTELLLLALAVVTFCWAGCGWLAKGGANATTKPSPGYQDWLEKATGAPVETTEDEEQEQEVEPREEQPEKQPELEEQEPPQAPAEKSGAALRPSGKGR